MRSHLNSGILAEKFFVRFSSYISKMSSHCGCAKCRSKKASCTPPLHSEQISVPHHVYTVHQQPIVKKWMTHEVQMDHVPVTQERRDVTHPTQQYCTCGQRVQDTISILVMTVFSNQFRFE